MRTVLIVEDNPILREGLALVVGRLGFETRAAANGADALKQLSGQWKPDVIVTDLRMPVMNGWEFRARQLADPGLADIPVIVLSGERKTREDTRTLKPAVWLEKPASILDVLNAIDAVCVSAVDAVCGGA